MRALRAHVGHKADVLLQVFTACVIPLHLWALVDDLGHDHKEQEAREKADYVHQEDHLDWSVIIVVEVMKYQEEALGAPNSTE